jgi:cysteinyl-tRNA synthetase
MRSSWAAAPLLLAGMLAVGSAAAPVFPFPDKAAAPPSAAMARPLLVDAHPTERNGADERRQRLGAVRHWGYWLSSIEIATVAAAPHDLLVIDSEISANRTFERDYRLQEVARMKRRPDGTRRVLLAYLSIGEAERYRPYWQQDWYDTAKRPFWLDKENRRWAGNFAVQFWRPEWQQLIFGTSESYLDRIVAQGFDGVYLDRADAFLQWRKPHPSSHADMVLFIAQLAAHARKKNPEFMVIMQNAEELLEDAPVLDAIDGIAKEDLLFGVRRAEEPNKPDDIDWSIELLREAKKAGRQVLVVEYLKDPEKMNAAATRILEEGFVPYFAPRRLHCLNPPAAPDVSGRLPEARCQMTGGR